MDCCCEDPRDPVDYCPAHHWRFVYVRTLEATMHKRPRKPNGLGTGRELTGSEIADLAFGPLPTKDAA